MYAQKIETVHILSQFFNARESERKSYQSELEAQAGGLPTTVKRIDPIPLPVFATSNFARVLRETCKTFEVKFYKNSPLREKYKLGVSEKLCYR